MGLPQIVAVLKEPFVGMHYSGFQGGARPPPHPGQSADIQQLAGRAVRLAPVESDLAFEPRRIGDDTCEFGDAYV